MDDYTPLSSPAFSLGGSSVASSVGSSRMSGTLRRLSSLFPRRRRSVSLKDIERHLRSTMKTYETAQRERKEAADTLLMWTSQLPDSRYRDLATKVHNMLLPLWTMDPNLKVRTNEILSGLENLKNEEAHRDKLVYELMSAERSYYKGLYHGLSPSETDPLDRNCQMLRIQADSADARYRGLSIRLMLKSLRILLVQCDEACRARQIACQSALEFLGSLNDNELLQTSAFDSPRPYDGASPYTPSPLVPADAASDKELRDESSMYPEYASPFAA